MKYLPLIFLSIIAFSVTKAQSMSGTTGLLNIPTANMQRDGTFMFGGNYLPEAITPESFSFNTGNYYINITFLPFVEVNYRLTLGQTKSTGRYNQQDRSFALRCRILKEGKFIPALVIGGNDLYTHTNGDGNQYFEAVYIVETKTFLLGRNIFSTTIGSGIDVLEKNQYDGIFGGISYSPYFFSPLTLIAEYDSKVFNTGISLFLFNHLSLHAFAYDLKYFCGGMQYKVYLKK